MTFRELISRSDARSFEPHKLLGWGVRFLPDGKLSGPPAECRIVSISVDEPSAGKREFEFGVHDCRGKYWEVLGDFLLLPDLKKGDKHD